MIGKIVKFCNATNDAAKWCIEHDLPGKVIGAEFGIFKVDVGLYYNIYVNTYQMIVIGNSGDDIEKLPKDMQDSAPVPDDSKR